MSKKLYNILVTNDDGIDAPGLFALTKAMSRLGKVHIVAPDRQQSAVGHALSISNPLRVMPFWKNGEKFGLSVNGTPSDCVKLAVSALLNPKPDLVVSGINHGQNTSGNVIYSGTVSAATEGMLLGIPSIAFSIANFSYKADFSSAEEYAYIIAKKVLTYKIPTDTLLNVNIPDLPLEKIKGIKITRQSNSVWEDYYEKREDPFGREYYWFSGNYKIIDDDIEADDVALLNGYVSITPLHLNFTNFKYMKKLKSFENLK